MGSELEPCPFCGVAAKTMEGEPWVVCGNYMCSAHNWDSCFDRDTWNSRPIESALRARVAELEAKLAESEAWAKVGRAGYRLRQASIAQIMEPGMVNGDSMDTAQFEFEATLAAATKRAGEEPRG